jgi:retron-type reverse transcriptase
MPEAEPIDLLSIVLGARGPADARRQLEALRDEMLAGGESESPVLAEIDATLAYLATLPASAEPEPAPEPEPPPLPRLPPRRPPRPRGVHFLGRGVSGRLSDHTCDSARLAALHLPVLLSPADLAECLGLDVGRLCWLAFHADVAARTHYVHFQVPKRSGGVRTLSRPHRDLAAAQGWILGHILERLPVSDACHGFVPGRSIVSNARCHARQDLIVNLDLENFFPSVGLPRVRKVFERAGYSPAVATVLALLCTECPRQPIEYAGRRYHVATGPRGLPQGACTSPALSNQVALRLDRRLGGLARRLDLAYTRYADDLTFSGQASLEPRLGWFLGAVERIILAEGFALNPKKTRILRRHCRQMVTGLVVNERPSVPRRELRRLRAILHRARHEGLEAQNRDGRPNFRAWLVGKIAYVRMARPDLGARLLAELEALTPEGGG